MSFSKDLESLFPEDFLLLQHEPQMLKDPKEKGESKVEEVFKSVNFNEDNCSRDLLENTLCAKNVLPDLISWKPVTESNQSNANISRLQSKIDVSRKHQDVKDLISFESEKLIDIDDKVSSGHTFEVRLGNTPKYCDNFNNFVMSTNLECEKDFNFDTEVTLGKVNLLKVDVFKIPFEKLTEVKTDNDMGYTNPKKKSADLVDLFDNLSVTHEDICLNHKLPNENIKYTTPFVTVGIQHHNDNGAVKHLNKAPCPEELKEIFPVSKIKANDNILAVKDDKILQVNGSNVTIKCDRTYIISAQPEYGLCSKCKLNTNKEKTITSQRSGVMEAISETETILKKNAATNLTAIQTLIDYEDAIKPKQLLKEPEIKTTLPLVETTNTEIYKEPMPIRYERETLPPQKASLGSEYVHGLKTNTHTPRCELQVLEEDHAKTRMRWQKQRKAIDEFINKGKVIK